ncbi:DMT family transporter [Sphingobacterium rhinopitheci]|uniref:DMT family transporter n=1 Tax=Sphingobacterium rhinopitheci TaxID=2781960 RepID=UPI001F51E85E|nr:DMT family transporter [Sphingobacterium rhinopitheci]MCI0921600.1 DMT family transporter [Sphingobacterium rhinopitheci]
MSFFERNRNVILLHFTVLIWGFTGVLGELITVSALQLVWYRVLIAAVTLFFYLIFTKKKITVPIKDMVNFLGVGALVGLHWIFFFHGIKIATVSVVLVTLSSLTLFTAILEPLFYKKRISAGDVVVGLLIILGIYLIFKFEFQYWKGIVFGLLAALCASIFSILNGKMVKDNSPTIITFYEMIGAWVSVSVIMLFANDFNSSMILSYADLFYLLVLGSVCTALAYVLGVAVMKELSAFTVALTTNLEPVYGILLAMLIIGQKEKMSIGFYTGALIILGAVFVYPVIRKKLQNRKRIG